MFALVKVCELKPEITASGFFSINKTLIPTVSFMFKVTCLGLTSLNCHCVLFFFSRLLDWFLLTFLFFFNFTRGKRTESI